MTGTELTRLAAALLLGAAIAFPAGLMLADRDEGPSQRARTLGAVRDVFSPSVRRDPHFVERQRENVEALEGHCRKTGETCTEAREARRWFDELAAEQ